MFSKLARNTFIAMRHPALGMEYVHWMVGQTIGRPLVVDGPFGTRLHASTFADLRSTRHFVPQPREVEMIVHLPSTQAVFVDIGANVGAWTTALAAAHAGCRV